jgi:hypothetical protein
MRDMRRGCDGLSSQVPQQSNLDPFNGKLSVFCGRVLLDANGGNSRSSRVTNVTLPHLSASDGCGVLNKYRRVIAHDAGSDAPPASWYRACGQ